MMYDTIFDAECQVLFGQICMFLEFIHIYIKPHRSIVMEKECTRCHKIQDLIEFYKRTRARKRPTSKVEYGSWCRTCLSELSADRHRNILIHDKTKINKTRLRTRGRLYLRNYLSTHPCVDCGESDPDVLEFDHRDGTVKHRCVSHMVEHSIKKIQLEIDKCDIRCCNCHMRRTIKQLGYYKYLNKQ